MKCVFITHIQPIWIGSGQVFGRTALIHKFICGVEFIIKLKKILSILFCKFLGPCINRQDPFFHLC